MGVRATLGAPQEDNSDEDVKVDDSSHQLVKLSIKELALMLQ